MQFVIKMVNVSAPNFVKTKGGGYSQIEAAFKKQDKDGKWVLDGKKLVDFNTKDNPGNKAVYDYCSSLQEGATVRVTAEKGEKFWNWVKLEPVGSDEVPAETNAGESQGTKPVSVDNAGVAGRGESSSQPRGRVTGSNYETPAERARRQIYIVRQSSITAALDLLKAITTPGVAGNGQPYIPITSEQVIEQAKKFEAYVFEKPAAFKDFEDDIPF